MKPLRSALDWLDQAPRHRTGARIAQAAVGLMILFRLATEARGAEYLWGPNGIAEGSMQWMFGVRLGGLLDQVFTTSAGLWSLLAVLATAALALVCGRATRVASLVALVTFTMVEQRMIMVGDGGDNIARVVLVFMVFLMPPRERAEPGSLRVWVHNVAVLAMIGQVLMLYATAGLMKAFGDKWHHGTALYYISQVELFWHPAARALARTPLVALAAYATVIHQLLFPVAFLSRMRVPWVVLGLSFHLGIALVMGLVSFSTVMIGLELCLLSDRDFGWLRGAFTRGVWMVGRRLRRSALADPDPA